MRQLATTREIRRRFFEPLEERLALAGNVTADTTTVAGALIIVGDNSSNAILVEQVGANTFKVTGLGTTVNGTSSAKTFGGVVNGIGIDMRGGSDSVTLKNMTVPGEGLGIVLGDGNDTLVMSNVTVLGTCGIDGGSGSNAITIDKCTFDYNLGVHTYDGNDALAISRSTVYGGLSIQLGDGTNALTMLSDKVLKPIVPGEPTDMIEIPPDFQVLKDAFFNIECGAIITTGDGTDAIAMNVVQIDCLTQIETGAGADSVAIANSRFGNQLLTVPEGIAGAVGLYVETGLGNGAVAIAKTTVYGLLQIDTSQQVACALTDVTPLTKVENTNDGNDSVALSKVTVLNAIPVDSFWTESEYVGLESGALLIYTGNGSDSVALSFVNTDAEAAIYTTDGSSLDGADAVAIAKSNFNRLNAVMRTTGVPLLVPAGLFIESGDGNDAVSIASVRVVGEVNIETGRGTDKVAINALVADSIFVDLGDGNFDALAITNSTAKTANFKGGGGTGDTLTRAHNHFGTEVDSGFEFVV